MKIFAKICKGLGIALLLVGGCAMDSASIIVPAIMAFGGLGIAISGAAIEDQYT